MLSVLIVNWNTRDLLRACLRSLESSCKALPHEIVVVENASSDGSAQMVREEFPDVRLLARPENLGFAEGSNLAYESSNGEWVWLLNPDTEVIGDAPARLLSFLQANPRCGAVASLLQDARTAKLQRSCRVMPSPGALWAEASGLAKLFPRSRRFGFYRYGWWNHGSTREVEQPMASSLMLRRAAIEACGGLFDAQFPIFFNDVDLCWRLCAGDWQVWYEAQARVKHWGGAGTGQVRPAMIEESHRALERFYHKHYRGRVSPPLYLLTIALIRASGQWRMRQAQRRAQRSI